MRFGVGVFGCFLLYFLPLSLYSQTSGGRMKELYRYVETADSLATKSFTTFYLEKFLKDNYNYRETWRYTTNNNKIIYFQVDYIVDSTEYSEVYYVDRGRLVCSEEYEKINYTLLEDQLKFGSILYFESAIPRHVVILGRRSHNWRFSDPGDMALSRFQKRYSELRKHLPMLP